jgi:hypothetical protein
MVNTVALVTQQAEYVRRHLHYAVGEYSGDRNVDFWPEEQWQEELSNHQVGCANGVLQVVCVVTGAPYLYSASCADHGDDMSDIPEPLDARLRTVV